MKKLKLDLKIGNTYFIIFGDERQPEYTHYTGNAVLLHEVDDHFGTNEQHYCFRLPSGDECDFPKSSIYGFLH